MIGVLGGTFDPIHFGHLRPALECREALGLTEVRLVPLNVAVHRPQPRAPAALRLAMLEAAIVGEPGLCADPRELDRPGGSFSYDTLRALREELGSDRPLCLLMGADAFRGFVDWYRPDGILELAHLVVMQRPGPAAPLPAGLEALANGRTCTEAPALRDSPGGRILYQPVTQLDISATQIRALVQSGRSVRYLVPDAVLALIARHGLYR